MEQDREKNSSEDRPVARELPNRTVERLSAYRRLLRLVLAEGRERMYSHELGKRAGVTPAQVRRDLMLLGYTGSPAKGYDIRGLVERIGELFELDENEGVVLVGAGHLGQAVLNYFSANRPALAIDAAFDVAADRVGQTLHGCPCYPLDDLERVAQQVHALVAIITVPPEAAQDVAERLVAAGVRGILNFAPVRLRLPDDVFVEDVDISVSLEKLAFFARRERPG